MKIERWLWKHREKGKRAFFWALSGSIYAFVIRCRHWLYDKGFFSSVRAPLAVVSVGNITAGGTGKTPIVALLAALLEKECQLAILSRGYRSRSEKRKRPTVVQTFTAWEEYGDEPCWLARRLSKTKVIVGKRRIESALLAHHQGCNLVILDDGMQHRPLKRDVEVVVVEGRDPFGGGHFLPRGRLREMPSRLACADLVMINGKISAEDKNKLSSLTQAPLVQGEMVVNPVLNRDGKSIDLAGQRVALFCAIGSPERCMSTIEALGGKIILTFILPDHHAFKKKELLEFAERAAKAGAEYLCYTEKDEVKLPALPEIRERLVVIKGEFIIKENQEAFEQLMQRIKILTKVKQ